MKDGKMKRTSTMLTWARTCLLLAVALPIVVNGQVETNFVWATNYDGAVAARFFLEPRDYPIFDLAIPDTVSGKPVTHILTGTFMNNTLLTNITIPDSVAYIDSYAFASCPVLASVTIGSGVTNLSNNTFANVGNGDPAFLKNPPPPNQVGFYFRGNAPTVDSTVLARDPKASVYYLPGTTGWSNTLGGLPAAIWQPKMQVISNGVNTNELSFNVKWASRRTVVVEACMDLSNPGWTAIATNTLTSGAFYFSDPQWKNFPGRSYRVRSQ
jgi:hypothetical protein